MIEELLFFLVLIEGIKFGYILLKDLMKNE